MDISRLQFIPLRTEAEVAAEVKAMKKAGARARKTREGTIALLVRTGMYTKTGRLKKKFR